jgi:hypothetical protein
MQVAIAASAILSVLSLLLVVGLIIIGFDTAMLKRNRPTLRASEEMNSGQAYIEAQQKKNPDRKLIFYGAGLLFQYVRSSQGSTDRQILLLPNFLLASMGLYNTPLNLLASVALHLDGVVVLLQYLLGHRYIVDPCPHCEHPWHPNDSGDTFHRPYSARVGQWWRRSYIDSRSFITATVGTIPSDAIRFLPNDLDQSSAGVKQVRRPSVSSLQRPSMRQMELPDAVFDMPKLSIFVPDDDMSISRSTQSSYPRVSTRRKFYLSPQRSMPRAEISKRSLSKSFTIPSDPETISDVAVNSNSISALPQRSKLLMSWKQSCKISEAQEIVAGVAPVSNDAQSERMLSDLWLPSHRKESGVIRGPM